MLPWQTSKGLDNKKKYLICGVMGWDTKRAAVLIRKSAGWRWYNTDCLSRRVFSSLPNPSTVLINFLTPNDHYSGRTAPLTSKRCILYIYSTNIGTEYFKHGIYSPFFFASKCRLFHNSNVFGSCIIHILYTECAKIKKNNSGTKRLRICLCDK